MNKIDYELSTFFSQKINLNLFIRMEGGLRTEILRFLRMKGVYYKREKNKQQEYYYNSYYNQLFLNKYV